MAPSSGDITRILQDWDSDRQSAMDALTPIVYEELHKIAVAYLRRQRPSHTLQPTALINEAYLRLVRPDTVNIKDRSHFFALSARIMRQILVDAARAHQSEKRGSGKKVPFDERIDAGTWGKTTDFLVVNEAFEKLEGYNARMARALELRFFGGLQLEEIAEVLEVGLATVKRDLSLGQAWLRRALNADCNGTSAGL
jgi:RNA polymerase sigma factor (TIGR02999 family)